MLVSEQMAQQTQVARVVPRYLEFLHRFPTPAACAAAPVGEVLRMWKGLGYNARALRLHGAACAVVERHGGRFPDRLDDLLALPGVGPYTARAVLAFAYEDDGAAVVDTNVLRVLSRWAGERLGPRAAQSVADGLVPAGRSWAWNQTVMELGATVCRAANPSCGACPVRSWCAWDAAGRPQPDPGATRSTQSRFEGSDRQGRGRLVDALRAGPVPWAAVPEVTGWGDDPARAVRVARTLVRDGLAVDRGEALELP